MSKKLAALGFVASLAFLWAIIGISTAATNPSENKVDKNALDYFSAWWPALGDFSKTLSLIILSLSCGSVGAGLGYTYGVFCYEAPEEESRLLGTQNTP